MKAIVLFTIMSLIESVAFSNVEKAVAAYKSEDYSTALKNWNAELKNPEANRAIVYFNLGNCLAKKRDFAQAILFYERALKENYNAEDVKFNLKVARAKLGLDTENKVLFVYDWVKTMAYIGTSNSYKWGIAIFAWTILIVQIVKRFIPVVQFNAMTYLLILGLVLLVVLLGLQTSFKSSREYAIVKMNGAEGFQNVTLTGSSKPIHEGEKLKIIDRVGDHIQVVAESDSSFWIQSSEINPI
jgi:tetratricopeptide (TPR) repeat protein